MQVVSSYSVEILHAKKIFQDTVDIYRKSLTYLIDVFSLEWNSFEVIEKNYERISFANDLVHSTKRNVAKYDFDERFPKMPTYFRRAVVRAALGILSSYHMNLEGWEKRGKKGARPRLILDHSDMPVFYNDEMYRASKDNDFGYIKLYIENDWKFVRIDMRPTDLKYLRKYWSHVKASAPKLEKRYGKYYLRFAFDEKVKLSSTPVSEKRICSVNLAANGIAVCSIMCADGTILARKFINFPSDTDHLQTVLNRIKKFNRNYGKQNVGSFWKYAFRLNMELAKKISLGITDFAVLYSVDCIVVEHVDFENKNAKGSQDERLLIWQKNEILNHVTHKAHRSGIRVSSVCVWGSTTLAYDGSGLVVPNKQNNALCTFSNGKCYNRNLSASYNIGARYFIREIMKSSSVKMRSSIEAKVPECGRRTSCTLDTLRRVTAVLSAA